MAVDDRREPAGSTELGDLLTDDVSILCGQRRAGGGHVGKPLDRMLSGFGLRLAGGAGSGEAPGSGG
jgi:hypothetical protein